VRTRGCSCDERGVPAPIYARTSMAAIWRSLASRSSSSVHGTTVIAGNMVMFAPAARNACAADRSGASPAASPPPCPPLPLPATPKVLTLSEATPALVAGFSRMRQP